MNDEIHVLTWSTNAGRYCFDDPEHGHDVTSGELLAIEVLNGLWVEGRVEHGSAAIIDLVAMPSQLLSTMRNGSGNGQKGH